MKGIERSKGCFGNKSDVNPPTLKSSGYSETWLHAGDAEA